MSNIISINNKNDQTKESIANSIKEEAEELLVVYTNKEGETKLSFLNMSDAEIIYIIELIKQNILLGEI